jgi:hypothetical protein
VKQSAGGKDCGVHAAINAWGVAFGFGEVRGLGKGDVEGKRVRIAVDLVRGGFRFRDEGEGEEPVMGRRNGYTGKVRGEDGRWMVTDVPDLARKGWRWMSRLLYITWAKTHDPSPLGKRMYVSERRGALDIFAIAGRSARLELFGIMKELGMRETWRKLLLKKWWGKEELMWLIRMRFEEGIWRGREKSEFRVLWESVPEG